MLSDMYHAASRGLQDRFDTRRVADRLADLQVHECLNDDEVDFIERSPMLFLATADGEGRPDCSYKGGAPGFVRVQDSGTTLLLPDYDGNGMFRSLGNIAINPNVGLLFIDFEKSRRLRINGIASLHLDDPLLGEFPGSQALVRVRPRFIFPNCPRYIHRMKMTATSPYTPRAGYAPPIPGWKRWDEIREVLPARQGPVGPGLATYARRLRQRSRVIGRLIELLKRGLVVAGLRRH